MSLILAVEPDRRQATQLSALVQQHIRAELVVADSGAAALDALAGRVPDLILTPALLPPKDEAVLTGWLRELGDAAAHVQTLAIPILAESEPRPREHGSSIFGRRRDPEPKPSHGCDPGVFAEQVRVYLDRAGSERAAAVPAAAAGTTTAAAPADGDGADVEEFPDAVTFDDLVFEPGTSIDPEPEPLAPVIEPAAAMRAPVPFPRAEPAVDEAVLRHWEAELGLDASPTAPPLWRVGAEDVAGPDRTAAAAPPPADRRPAFDPADPLFAPLFQRLDELAAACA